ncbi:MAG: DUF3078 domain-containing protein [Bacteroidales bacterium]
MKLLISFLLVTMVLQLGYSQENADTLWKFNGVVSLNLSQMSLTNWAAGGENSFSGNGMLNLNANYNSRDKIVNWNNELLLGYGMIKQGSDLVRKSDDRIDMASKIGYKASKNWKYTALLSFKTQFTEGYANPGDITIRSKISNFMAPGYLNLSFGMDYKPSETFTMFIAPVTGKMTFVMDDDLSAAGSFGVEAGQNIRSEFGGYVKIAFTQKLMKNVKLNTKVDLFSNYLENPQYVDVNFDLLLSLKVNEYISASFITQIIYDYDIKFEVVDEVTRLPTGEVDTRLQLKELFGIGLTYSF